MATCKGDCLAHSPPGYVGHAHSLGIIRLQGEGGAACRQNQGWVADPDPHPLWGSWIRIRIQVKNWIRIRCKVSATLIRISKFFI
jgi:hypothetical protein